MSGYLGIFSNNPLQLTNFSEEQFYGLLIEHLSEHTFGLLYYESLEETPHDDKLVGHTLYLKRYAVAIQGHLLNEDELRAKYVDQEDQEQSTEKILAYAFAQEGVSLFEKLRGPFSILIWDQETETLYGARDHFGIETLYLHDHGTWAIISSDKKAITAFQPKEVVKQQSLQHYLSFQYVPDPLTMSEGIYKLQAGHYFIKKQDEPLNVYRYFTPYFNGNVSIDERQLIRKIRDVLITSVENHVPKKGSVGSFLSGGIDSSLLASIAQRLRPDLKTFTVGFKAAGYSEVEIAKQTAESLQVENYDYQITMEEYISVLPRVIWEMDDPLADPSAVALYIANREAKKHVDVVLSGEGADELFGGYNIYRESESLKYVSNLPNPMLKALNMVASIIPEGVKGKSFLERATTPLKERYIGNAKIFEEKEKQKILKQYDKQHTYQAWTEPIYQQVQDQHAVEKMQFIDVNTWLQGDILLKANKMAKANQLDVRMPFLDKAVFDIAQQIPVHFKIADGTTKVILRRAALGIAPDHVLQQRKLGYPVPLRYWLKNDMYEWAIELIKMSETDDLIDKGTVLNLLHEHKYTKKDHARKIWTILVFMIWHQIFIENKFNFIQVNKQDKGLELKEAF